MKAKNPNKQSELQEDNNKRKASLCTIKRLVAFRIYNRRKKNFNLDNFRNGCNAQSILQFLFF